MVKAGTKGFAGCVPYWPKKINNILVAWEKWLTETDDAERFADQNESNVES